MSHLVLEMDIQPWNVVRILQSLEKAAFSLKNYVKSLVCLLLKENPQFVNINPRTLPLSLHREKGRSYLDLKNFQDW